MSYKKIMGIFSVSLVISVVLRIIQDVFLIDGTTGFSEDNRSTANIIIVGMIAALLLLTCVFSLRTRRSFDKPPKVKLPLALVSFAMVLICVIDMLTIVGSSLRSFYPLWEILIIFAGEILAAVYFACYGLNAFTKVRITPLAHLIPLIYATVRLIRIFAQTSYISVIVDNLFLIFSAASSLIFALEFARVNNGYTTRDDCKRLLCMSNVNTIICFCASISPIVNMVVKAKAIAHADLLMILSAFCLGLFSLGYSAAFFKVYKREHHSGQHHSSHSHSTAQQVNEFYSGDGPKTEHR